MLAHEKVIGTPVPKELNARIQRIIADKKWTEAEAGRRAFGLLCALMEATK